MAFNYHKFSSSFLEREVDLTILSFGQNPYKEVLIINDGQDLSAMNLIELKANYSQLDILIVGCGAAPYDGRKEEYGVQWSADYKGRGAKANKYAQFITNELLAWVKSDHFISEDAKFTLAGWSLGALSAIDIAWHASHNFHRVGLFSGSLWWRNPYLIQDDVHHRLMHHRVKNSTHKPDLKFWFQAGTEDEKADRNNNGIIDVIDDTLDLINELDAKGYQKGSDYHFHIEEGGRHDLGTWSKMMPLFLDWIRRN